MGNGGCHHSAHIHMKYRLDKACCAQSNCTTKRYFITTSGRLLFCVANCKRYLLKGSTENVSVSV